MQSLANNLPIFVLFYFMLFAHLMLLYGLSFITPIIHHELWGDFTLEQKWPSFICNRQSIHFICHPAFDLPLLKNAEVCSEFYHCSYFHFLLDFVVYFLFQTLYMIKSFVLVSAYYVLLYCTACLVCLILSYSFACWSSLFPFFLPSDNFKIKTVEKKTG